MRTLYKVISCFYSYPSYEYNMELLKITSCIYVPEIQSEREDDCTTILGTPYSPFACSVPYQVSFKSTRKINREPSSFTCHLINLPK